MTHAIDNGDCRIAIVIPPDFSLRLNDSGKSSVQAIVDATDDNTASVAAGYAQAVVATYSAQVQLDASSTQGRPAVITPLVVQSRVWFNEDLDSKDFIIPGAGRDDPGPGRGATHLPHRLARMGTRHDGAA